MIDSENQIIRNLMTIFLGLKYIFFSSPSVQNTVYFYNLINLEANVFQKFNSKWNRQLYRLQGPWRYSVA